MKWPAFPPRLSFRLDDTLVVLFVLGALALWSRDWLARHPEHNPWAPLTISQAEGWATGSKLAALRGSVEDCRAVLERSEIAFEQREPVGEGECRRADRVLPLADTGRGLAFTPTSAYATCAVHAGQAWWLEHRVQPAAEELLGSRVERIVQLGTANCRRMNNSETGQWSEHATGNAIDIAAFELADGRQVSVLDDWDGSGPAAAFLRAARDGACDVFGTTLSPDYNALHANHFHLDQARRSFGRVCR